MPSKLSSENLAPNVAVDETEKSYQRLLAFLDLASGSAFAIARCNLPSLRKEILQRAAADAKAKGVVVKEVDISSKYSGDFVAAIKAGLDGTPAAGRLAVMVTGIDGLIYQSASQENLAGEGRTPFIARLNFNREYISHELPFPLILWLESESLTLLLKQAPDFTQWISSHFHFGGPAAEAKAIDDLFDSYKSLPGQPASEIRKQLQEFSGLLQELNETRYREDSVALRKRFAVLSALGDGCWRLSQFAEAQGYFTQALDLSKKLSRRDQAGALVNLGITYADSGHMHQAIECYEEALAINQQIGDRHAEGIALGNLGAAYRHLGQTKRAIECCERALAIHQGLGDRHAESATLGNLGNGYEALGDFRRAIEFHEKALEIDRATGDSHGEGQDLGNLGNASLRLGDVPRAIEYYGQALSIHREIGDRQDEGNALTNLGTAYGLLGQHRRAVECYEQALAIRRDIGDRLNESKTLARMGLAYARLGESRPAIEFYRKAIAIDKGIGDRRGEGVGLWYMGLAFDRLGDPAQAIASAEAALKILEEIEDPNAAKVRQQLAEWRKG
jgi:tetratricopeptide (TPR) repeat protein